jgi:hypothetical protein
MAAQHPRTQGYSYSQPRGTEILSKMAVFWVVAPCSLVEVHQSFRGPCCLHQQGGLIVLMMEAAITSETLVNLYQTTRRYNPKDSHLRTHRRENLKSYSEISSDYLPVTEFGFGILYTPELN